MSEYKFTMLDSHPGVVFVLSHSYEEVQATLDTDKQQEMVDALKAYVETSDIVTPEDFNGVMYVPYDFHVDEEGAVIYTGPDADDPLYVKERFTKAINEFTESRAMELGMENPDEPWVNVGGTFCCGPSWRENPCYEGEHGPTPEETVH